MIPSTLTLTQPDDWHVHLRDGEWLSRTVRDTERCFARAMVMPNLVPPITTLTLANAYHQRILSARSSTSFQPLMTLYLTDETSPSTLQEAKASGILFGVKYYPAGATTHSQYGVTDLKKVYPVLEAMQKIGLPLLVHGEVRDPTVDIFDAEKRFVERELAVLLKDFPELKVVFEHISTKEAVDFVRSQKERLAATITAHHLLYTRNELLKGGLKPHLYCAPILKTDADRAALIEAATSGDPHFFLGTDSAPHFRHNKECQCASAGIYTAHAALELYAGVFEQAGKLDRLEAFASLNGACFYGLPRNTQKIKLVKQPWKVPAEFKVGKETLVPLKAGEIIKWLVVGG